MAYVAMVDYLAVLDLLCEGLLQKGEIEVLPMSDQSIKQGRWLQESFVQFLLPYATSRGSGNNDFTIDTTVTEVLGKAFSDLLTADERSP
jgi:hypothetical protein